MAKSTHQKHAEALLSVDLGTSLSGPDQEPIPVMWVLERIGELDISLLQGVIYLLKRKLATKKNEIDQEILEDFKAEINKLAGIDD